MTPASPMPLTMAARLRAPATVVWRELRGGPLVLDTQSGQYFHLVGSSAAIWRLIEERHALDAVVEEAAVQHGVSATVVQRDVTDFVASALSSGLLEIEAQPAASRESLPAEETFLQIGRAGLRVAADLTELEAEFNRQHYVRLPQLLAPDVLDVVERSVRAAQFVDRTHPGIGREQCLLPGPATGALQLLFNDPALFDVVGRISRCEGIRCFDGRIYRMLAEAGHYDSWHSDAGKNRCVAVSLNLSLQSYDGGALEIRQVSSTGADHVVPPVPFGSAVMFRISPVLRHRVTPVRNTQPRTAYAGWFCTAPDFENALFASLTNG